MQKHDLFRSEVMQHSSTSALGQIVLIRPLTFTFYAVSSILLVGTLCLLLMSGNYTKKARISGVLVPDRGIFKVIAPSAGIVVDMQVAEGNQIVTDAPVVTLSTERASLMQRQTQGTIGRKLGERKASLADEIISFAFHKYTAGSEKVFEVYADNHKFLYVLRHKDKKWKVFGPHYFIATDQYTSQISIIISIFKGLEDCA